VKDFPTRTGRIDCLDLMAQLAERDLNTATLVFNELHNFNIQNLSNSVEERKDSDTRSSSDSSFDKLSQNSNEPQPPLAASFFKVEELPNENEKVCTLSTRYMAVDLYLKLAARF
jgi:hypothetical protein